MVYRKFVSDFFQSRPVNVYTEKVNIHPCPTNSHLSDKYWTSWNFEAAMLWQDGFDTVHHRGHARHVQSFFCHFYISERSWPILWKIDWTSAAEKMEFKLCHQWQQSIAATKSNQNKAKKLCLHECRNCKKKNRSYLRVRNVYIEWIMPLWLYNNAWLSIFKGCHIS